MLKPNKLCNVCKAVKGNQKLAKEIYSTKFFLKGSPTSLRDVQENHPSEFTYQSLLNHVKHHQFLSDEDFSERHLRKIAKDAEKRILRREITSKQVWDDVIYEATGKLERGELKVTANHLLKAAKDKSDYELKQTDQQLAWMDMVFHFASGENDTNESRKYDRRLIDGQEAEDFDPANPVAGDPEERENRSRSFYQRVTGDALTPGAD